MVPKLSCVIVIASLELYMKASMLPKKPKTLRIPNSIETFEPMHIL